MVLPGSHANERLDARVNKRHGIADGVASQAGTADHAAVAAARAGGAKQVGGALAGDGERAKVPIGHAAR